MDLFDTLQLELQDINFNVDDITKNLSDIRKMEEKRELLEKDLFEDESDIENERLKEEREQEKIIMELFGESDNDEEDSFEQDKEEITKEKMYITKNTNVLKDLIRDDSFGVKKIENDLNNGLESDEKFKIEKEILEPIKRNKKENILGNNEMEKEDIIKIIFPKEKDEKTDSEEKIMSSSFNEKLELVKQEIEKIDKKGKKECPEGKELNPKTGKCVKRCDDGYIRDQESFKCKKIKKEEQKREVIQQEIKLLDDYYEFSDGKFFNWIVVNDYMGFNESDMNELKSKENIIMFDKGITIKVPVDRYGEKEEKSIKISKPVTVKNFIKKISDFYNKSVAIKKRMGDLLFYEGIQKGEDDKLYLVLGS